MSAHRNQFLTSARDLSRLSNLHPLFPSVSHVMVNVFDSAQAMNTNKELCLRLSNSLTTLLEVIRHHAGDARLNTPEDQPLTSSLATLHTQLENALLDLQRIRDLHPVRRFIDRERIKRQLKTHLRAIDDVTKTWMMSNTLTALVNTDAFGARLARVEGQNGAVARHNGYRLVFRDEVQFIRNFGKSSRLGGWSEATYQGHARLVRRYNAAPDHPSFLRSVRLYGMLQNPNLPQILGISDPGNESAFILFHTSVRVSDLSRFATKVLSSGDRSHILGFATRLNLDILSAAHYLIERELVTAEDLYHLLQTSNIVLDTSGRAVVCDGQIGPESNAASHDEWSVSDLCFDLCAEITQTELADSLDLTRNSRVRREGLKVLSACEQLEEPNWIPERLDQAPRDPTGAFRRYLNDLLSRDNSDTILSSQKWAAGDILVPARCIGNNDSIKLDPAQSEVLVKLCNIAEVFKEVSSFDSEPWIDGEYEAEEIEDLPCEAVTRYTFKNALSVSFTHRQEGCQYLTGTHRYLRTTFFPQTSLLKKRYNLARDDITLVARSEPNYFQARYNASSSYSNEDRANVSRSRDVYLFVPHDHTHMPYWTFSDRPSDPEPVRYGEWVTSIEGDGGRCHVNLCRINYLRFGADPPDYVDEEVEKA